MATHSCCSNKRHFQPPYPTSGAMHAKSASCISVEGLHAKYCNNNVIRGQPDPTLLLPVMH